MADNCIKFRHNAEIAHRLHNVPGKCIRIHGHSLHVELTIWGELKGEGMLAGIDFHQGKKAFRAYLDRMWDHSLHLDVADPIAEYLKDGGMAVGLVTWPFLPTTENIAREMLKEMVDAFTNLTNNQIAHMSLEVSETDSNGAVAHAHLCG